MSIEEEIIKLVKEHTELTFGELQRNVPGFRGDRIVFLDASRNLLAWVNVSEEAADALNNLVLEGGILYRQSPFVLFNYLYDGDCVPFQVADRIRTYRSPRWLPVMVCVRTKPLSKKEKLLLGVGA